MLKEFLIRGGKANIREIATAFLTRDQSQVEYYEQITKKMPGKVLTRPRHVERDGDSYKLTMGSLSKAERDKLVALCDTALSDYLQKRRAGIYDHAENVLRPFRAGKASYQFANGFSSGRNRWRRGDIKDPKGGIRAVNPGKADY